MSHIRSGLSGVSVPIGADGSSHNTITNNVVIKTDSKERFKDKNVKEVSDGVYVVYPDGNSDKADKNVVPNALGPVETDTNPYANLNTRNLETAQARLDDIKNTQPDNEKLIQALSLIIDILYNNPLYVNKFIVAQIDTLRKLVQILTDADDVEITTLDPTCDCCGGASKIGTIDSIYVRKNNNVLEFKYSFVEAKQILESNHISMKLVSL